MEVKLVFLFSKHALHLPSLFLEYDKSVKSLPSLIITDIKMPTMDGYLAAKKLGSIQETKDIPIIVLTAHAMAGDREKALEAGADEYDTKPIEFKRLLGKIKEFLED